MISIVLIISIICTIAGSSRSWTCRPHVAGQEDIDCPIRRYLGLSVSSCHGCWMAFTHPCCAGLAGLRGRRGRGAPKSSDPGGVAGRCKNIGVAHTTTVISTFGESNTGLPPIRPSCLPRTTNLTVIDFIWFNTCNPINYLKSTHDIHYLNHAAAAAVIVGRRRRRRCAAVAADKKISS
jgi:hypothetical protein